VVSTNANSTPVRLTDTPVLDFNPFFSPDGRQIAFLSERDGQMDIYLMDADGKNQRRLPKSHPGNRYALGHYINWLDNASLLNGVQVEGAMAFYRVFVADGRLEKVNTIDPVPAIGGHGSFSPDRKRFMNLDYPHAHIWVISLTENAGKIVYQKLPQASTIDYPWWSPDGRWATIDVSIPRNSELLMAEWGEK
jgi:Tol biopolymer transport system component